jgi:putative addiction module killer protein
MLPLRSVEILEYLDRRGNSPYARWFDNLNAEAASRVVVALTRLARGNFSGLKSLGRGLHEYRIHFGPGLRIYMGKDGERLVILLGGGTKNRQQNDIRDAFTRWQEYKIRKAQKK